MLITFRAIKQWKPIIYYDKKVFNTSLNFTPIIFRRKFKSNIKESGEIKQNIKNCFESKQIQNCDENGWSTWIIDNEIYNKKIRYNF